MSLVSVIVPTFNQARYLPICLDSIWFQDHPDIEIIVVDDGSTDDTAATLDRYEADVAGQTVSYAADYNAAQDTVERLNQPRYPAAGRRLIRLPHAGNRGLSAALNTGFQAATGPYCTFIASDDMLLPSMMSELTAVLDGGADFAYADMHVVDDAGRILRRFSLPDYDFQAAFCHWYLCGVCKLYRRELHDRFGWYDEAYTVQDHELFLRFAMGGARFAHLAKVLANVRIHDGQREVDNHSSANMKRLYRESADLTLRARRHAASA